MPRLKEKELKHLRDERSEQIAEAALRVFVKKGYNGTKISEIAAEAGVSHGLVYHYYKSKENMLETLTEKVLSESYNALSKFEQIEGNPPQVLRSLTEFILSESNGYYFAFVLQLHTSDYLPQAIHSIMDRYAVDKHIDALLPLFEAGQAQGLFVEGEARDLVVYYFSIVQGLMLQSLLMPQRFRFPSIDLILGGILKDV
ncbi:TetR/AcrR family transcriptional regulator [Cohnella sp. 56]|uniref:TetR/AcrR family transcriptional regulator n=1 Tax=Cohnella sp. 56 TaxID=3113722 RepID=UPI0030E7FE3B